MYTTALKIANAARNIEIRGGKAATMTEVNANDFLQWTDDLINAKLSAVYYTPLTQIVRSGVTQYPPPIEFIATNLAAGYMVEALYSRIEPSISDAGKVHKENALQELDELVKGDLVGSYTLDGQTRKARNPFANPNACPLPPPNTNRGF